MDDKNLNDKSNEDSSPLISDLNSKFAQADKQVGLVSSSKVQLAKKISDQTAAQEALSNAISNSAVGLVGFSNSLMNDGGKSFESLNKVIDTTSKVVGGLASMIPYVGGALEGIVKGGAEVGKLLVTAFAKAYGNFEKLSDTGVVTTFEDFTKAADKTGLTFEDTTRIMGEHSKQMALFGGNALLGTKRYEAIAAGSKQMSEDFQKIGISAGDFADYQLSYINQQTMAGRSQKLTDKQLEEGTREYINQLDDLAKLTGKSRKELQSDLNERMSDVRYASSIGLMDKTIRATIDSVLSTSSQLNPGFSKSLTELIASGGVARTEEAENLRYALAKGGLTQEFFRDLRSGKIDAKTAQKQINTALANYGDSAEKLAAGFGAINKDTILYVEAMKAKGLLTNEQAEQQIDIAKQRKDQMDTTKGTNAEAARSRRAMYNTTKNLDLLATSSGMMTKVIKGLAGGVDKATESIYNLLGKETPEYLKLRREENKKQTELNDLQTKLNKQIERDAKLEKLDPKSEEARQLRRQQMTKSDVTLLQTQIKVTEAEIKELSLKRKKAETDNLNSRTGSTGASDSSAPSGAPSETPSGAQPSTPSGAPAAPSGSQPSGTPAGPGQPAPTGLGSLSQKYESNKEGSMAVGVDKAGGASYGKYQIASKTGTMAEFLTMLDKTNPEAAKRLRSAGPADSGKNGRFAQEWRKLAGEGALGESESQFAFSKIYTPALNRVKSPELKKMIESDRGLQEMFFSSSIQHGPGGSSAIFNKVYRPGISKQDFVRAVYAERGTYLSKQTPKERAGVLNRYQLEQRDVLATLGTSTQPTPAATAAAPSGATLGTSQAAIASGPTTGYPAALAGTVAVIPANSGSEASALSQQTGTDKNAVNTINMINQKLDRVIDVSTTNLRNTRNAVNV